VNLLARRRQGQRVGVADDGGGAADARQSAMVGASTWPVSRTACAKPAASSAISASSPAPSRQALSPSDTAVAVPLKASLKAVRRIRAGRGPKPLSRL
jgi:hypothetical protein